MAFFLSFLFFRCLVYDTFLLRFKIIGGVFGAKKETDELYDICILFFCILFVFFLLFFSFLGKWFCWGDVYLGFVGFLVGFAERRGVSLF